MTGSLAVAPLVLPLGVCKTEFYGGLDETEANGRGAVLLGALVCLLMRQPAAAGNEQTGAKSSDGTGPQVAAVAGPAMAVGGCMMKSITRMGR